MHLKLLIAATRADLARLGPIPDSIFPILENMGHGVDIIFAEDDLVEIGSLRPSCDLYVLKAHDDLCIGLAGILASRGARILNPYESCLQAENKMTAMHRLRGAGIAVPDTWITTDPRRLLPLLSNHALIVKPHVGGMGRSELIRKVGTASELSGINLGDGTYIIQTFIPG